MPTTYFKENECERKEIYVHVFHKKFFKSWIRICSVSFLYIKECLINQIDIVYEYVMK